MSKAKFRALTSVTNRACFLDLVLSGTTMDYFFYYHPSWYSVPNNTPRIFGPSLLQRSEVFHIASAELGESVQNCSFMTKVASKNSPSQLLYQRIVSVKALKVVSIQP